MLVALAVAAVVSIMDTTALTATPLGTVTVSQQTGGVADTPVFGGATTSTPCPATYGSDVLLRVGRPGGPFTNLAPPVSGGGFDRAPVTVRPNRSLATAVGAAPDDGEWWVVVECFSFDNGRHPERFVTPITVASGRWRQGAPAAPRGGAAPSDAATPAAPDGGATPGTAGATATPGPAPSVAAAPATPTAAPAAAGGTRSTWLLGAGGATFAVLLAGGAVVAVLARRRAGPTSSGSPWSGGTVHTRQRK